MMRNKAKRLFALLAAAFMMLALAGCSDDIIDLTGNTGDEEAVTNEKWGEETSGTITLPEDMDATTRFATELVDGSMYVVFNGIQKRDTGYFSAPDGTLTFTASATAESENIQEFKVAIWKLVDGGTQYVDGTTIYYKTDGSAYTSTISGLDASARYRLTISYDSSKYYSYGKICVEGVGEMGAAPAESEETDSSSVEEDTE